MSVLLATVSDPLVLGTLALALAGILGSAAAPKWRDREGFGYALENYELLPAALIPAAALAIPCAETFTALGLLAPATRPYAAGAAAALFLVFSLGIAVNLARGRDAIDCGCGGAGGDQPISWWLVARNLVLVALALVLVREPAARAFVWLDYISLVGGTAACVGCYALANQLLANAPRLERLRNH
ncbi:MAG: methylamine utilization protein MauE [Gammaproteobacteria bacterium]|nr:methylamine utilization protein MauE [Gammaproteobacteria bacterium]